MLRVKTAMAAAALLLAAQWSGAADPNVGDGNVNVDLAVRQVTVSPVRAHVGDVIRVEVVIENKAEGMSTTNAEVYANGKRVGRQLFTWGLSQGEDRLYRFAFDWDTHGVAPGEYRIKGEAFVWEDTSKFDNELTVPQPVILAAPGSGFPGGGTTGGSATETDPRFRKSRTGI
ncbi:MAG: hypothetical protein HZB86_11805 [Deltaproteobacteria bacterium]|nr:hypothetical protein [Deltaproteobacteria bacterium]